MKKKRRRRRRWRSLGSPVKPFISFQSEAASRYTARKTGCKRDYFTPRTQSAGLRARCKRDLKRFNET